MALAPVGVAFPAITRLTIETALGAQAVRVGGVAYDIDIEGLESEDGTIEFQRMFPR